jgi:hypothetical protein
MSTLLQQQRAAVELCEKYGGDFQVLDALQAAAAESDVVLRKVPLVGRCALPLASALLMRSVQGGGPAIGAHAAKSAVTWGHMIILSACATVSLPCATCRSNGDGKSSCLNLLVHATLCHPDEYGRQARADEEHSLVKRRLGDHETAAAAQAAGKFVLFKLGSSGQRSQSMDNFRAGYERYRTGDRSAFRKPPFMLRTGSLVGPTTKTPDSVTNDVMVCAAITPTPVQELEERVSDMHKVRQE